MTQTLRHRYRARQSAWRNAWRHDLDAPGHRWLATVDMMLFDHGLLRFFWPNRAKVAPGVMRSSQPTPGQIARLARRGFRSVVNMRGASPLGSYLLEAEACEEHGLELFLPTLTSRAAPQVEEVEALAAVFATAPRPMLIHCKSGADRAGIASALYLLLETDAPVEQAQAQLSPRFLHFRRGKTGILDAFVDAYAQAAQTGLSFRDWLRNDYDPAELTASFQATGDGDLLVDSVLRRE